MHSQLTWWRKLPTDGPRDDSGKQLFRIRMEEVQHISLFVLVFR